MNCAAGAKTTTSLRPAELRAALALKVATEARHRDMQSTVWWSSQTGATRKQRSLHKVIARRLADLFNSGQHKKMKVNKIVAAAQTGDIVLMNSGQTFEGRIVSQALVRGVASTNERFFLPRRTEIDSWNQIGIVVVIDDGIVDKVDSNGPAAGKYLLSVDAGGLTASKLEDALLVCGYRNYTCAWRCLITSSELRSRLLAHLKSILACSLKGHGQWFKAKRALTSDENDSRDRVAIDALIVTAKRVARVAYFPTPDEINEVLRIFFVMDEEKRGVITLDKLRATIEGRSSAPIRNTNIKSQFAKSTESDYRPNSADKMSSMFHNIDKADNVEASRDEFDDGEQSPNRPTKEFSLRMESAMWESLSVADKNGDISLANFVDAYVKSVYSEDQSINQMLEEAASPRKNENSKVQSAIRNFIDLTAVARAEFVATLLHQAGIISITGNSEFSSSDLLGSATHMNIKEYFCPSSFTTKGPPNGMHGVELASVGNKVADKLMDQLLLPVHLNCKQYQAIYNARADRHTHVHTIFVKDTLNNSAPGHRSSDDYIIDVVPDQSNDALRKRVIAGGSGANKVVPTDHFLLPTGECQLLFQRDSYYDCEVFLQRDVL